MGTLYSNLYGKVSVGLIIIWNGKRYSQREERGEDVFINSKNNSFTVIKILVDRDR